ncbi:hypothetical protein OCU04_011682 [Sclerotinia nivalis]|uniref:C2H2-type domain-containing protein n=1 Tax=Sclerotinia nivalis TaxID=352851 RepID=A0A9X0AC87_9HELO|nr:hypothetical protein OCU04_011682 [Sclerotinia nivalis]
MPRDKGASKDNVDLWVADVIEQSSPPQSSSAKDAILGLSQTKLQEILTEIIRENDSIRHEFEKKALVELRHVIPYHSSTEIELDENAVESHLGPIDEAASKVLVPRFAICENDTCGKMFDVSSNSGRLCRRHLGSIMIFKLAACWKQHNTEEWTFDYWHYSEEYAYREGFMWSCCDADPDNPGCRKTRHRSRYPQDLAKSHRY